MKRAALVAAIFFVGCAANEAVSPTEPAFVQTLKRHGVTPDNIRRIELVGSEGGYGGSLQVTITAEFLIQEIWDTIYQSRPYRAWVASGDRTLRLYTSANSNTPDVEIMVNATDRCHIKGIFEIGYRCPGINRVLEPELKREYAKRKGG